MKDITRILRAVYHRAVEDDIIENRNPFRHVYTGVDKSIKRALPLPTIKKIKALDLSLSPPLDYARDMFLMSFYLRGMSFIDTTYLKKTDLKNGSIVYRRRKTGQQLTIAWAPEMQAILDKYPDKPILRNIYYPSSTQRISTSDAPTGTSATTSITTSKDSWHGRNQYSSYDVRWPLLMGQCSKS